MSKTNIIKYLLSIILLMYLTFALSFTTHKAANDMCNGLVINVVDSLSRQFVTASDIDVELGALAENIRNVTRDSLNTYDIERQILAMDYIEDANCQILNNGVVRIDVVPLIPIARVFDRNGDNYYINRAGKRMKASTRFRMDVPVIIGEFKDNIKPSDAFPLIDFLGENEDWNEMTNAIEFNNNGDLILIPKIKGHVINLGDTLDLDNKFKRLRAFYRQALPNKGWEYYDTLTLKWKGQVVAKRRNAKPAASPIIIEEHEDLDDEGTMLTTTVTN